MGYKTSAETQAWFRRRYLKTQLWLRAYKVERGCADCGYNEHHAALEFDHVEPHLYGPVSSLAGSSMNRIQAELARCEVVCANCHRVRTFNRTADKRPEGL